MNFMIRLEKSLMPGLYKFNGQNQVGFEIAKPTECIKQVIFNNPATIVIWSDGSKTVVKCKNEPYDPEKGLAMCIAKRAMGNTGNYYNIFKKFLPDKTIEKSSTTRKNNGVITREEVIEAVKNFINRSYGTKSVSK